MIFAKKTINLSTFFLLRVNHDLGDNADVIDINNPTIDRVVSHYGVNNVLIVIMLIMSFFWDLLSLLHWKTIGKVVSVDCLQYDDMNAIVVKELHLKAIGWTLNVIRELYCMILFWVLYNWMLEKQVVVILFKRNTSGDCWHVGKFDTFKSRSYDVWDYYDTNFKDPFFNKS